MIRAAGLFLVTKDNKALFVKRSLDSEAPGLWCTPGGKIEPGETAEEAAERETTEEVGPAPHANPTFLTRTVTQNDLGEEVDFTTFRAVVAEEFIPTLSDEHTAWCWASVNDPPEPLHPGVRITIDRLSMDELGVARAMAAGQLTSPQKYGNFWLFEIRISGTGLAYRPNLDEYVWRDEAYYTHPDFLARCNGLPVIYNHPEKKTSLDSEEFNKRIIGTVFVPFVKGSEAWAICKIWDDASAKLMATEQMSTSPGVVFFREGNTNETLEFADGSTLLIEGRPHILDHIAVCEKGVWDKLGPASGIISTIVKDIDAMTTEEQAAADKARNDAAAKLQVIADTLARLDARMDSIETARKDAAEKEEKERNDRTRHDAARKDKFGRKDGETYMDAMKRWDADEMGMCDELTKSGDDEETAKKAAKDARKDAMEGMKRADAESFEKWANEEEKEKEHKADKARKDAEEKAIMDAKKDAARMDATTAENADLRARLAAMEATLKGITAETPASERDALASAQARADSVAAMFGDRAPPAVPGETALDYRKRLINRFKSHSRLKDSRFDALDAAQLAPLEDVVYADAVAAARAPATATPGRLVAFEERDRAGRTITKYHGDIKAFMAPFMMNPISGKFVNPTRRI